MISLTLVRRIAARPSIVFDALTTADGIAAWWGPDERPVTLAEMDAHVGGAYRVRFSTADGQEHEACGECLEIVRPVHAAFSWRWAVGGEPDEFGRASRIEFDLRPIEIGTELTFTHANLVSDASRQGHGRGWSGSFAKLERYLRDVQAAANAPGLA